MFAHVKPFQSVYSHNIGDAELYIQIQSFHDVALDLLIC